MVPAWAGAVTNYPYPQNTTYAFGQKPANPSPTGGPTWNDNFTYILGKYNAWKAVHAVTAGAGGFRRIRRDGADGNDTVSEGISYGMLLAVYFNDQALFDDLWRYKQLHNDGLGLMHWRIDAGGGTTGSNSATDADEDIAYSLYLAYRQWGTSAVVGNYKTLADAEVAKIKGFDLNGSLRLKPGDSFDSCRYPSYFFPNEYRVFGIETSDSGTWNTVRANCYATIAAARNATTGLLAEQCTDTGQGGGCAGISTTQYLYNSCRIPFRMALDYVYYGDSNANTELNLISTWLNSTAPGSTGDCYNLNGGNCGGMPNGSFMGPFATAFMRSGSSASQLQAYYNALMVLNHDNDYYHGALQLLTLLLLSGNMPNIADPSAIYTPTRTRTPTPYAGTPTQTFTPTPMAFSLIFEDFELGTAKNAYTYACPTCSASYVVNTSQPSGGLYSDVMTINVPAAGYAGHGFESNYAAGNGVSNFTGSTKIRFYIKSSANINYRISFKEGTPAQGGDSEGFLSPLQAAASSGTFQMVEIAIPTGWTEDTNNPSCTPNCATTGNGALNLASIFQFQIAFNATIPAGTTVVIDDIAFIPGVAPTATATRTPFNNPYNQIFDDFEAPMSLSTTASPPRAANFADTANGASSSWSIDTATVASGSRSGRLTYNTGTGASYGTGGFFMSPYSAPDLTVDASGAVLLGFWINGVAGLRYKMAIQEAGQPLSPTAGPEGEAFESPQKILPVSGWQWVEIEIPLFTEDPYNPLCTPNCATTGDGLKDLQAISSVSLKLNGAQGSGSVYLDDVSFITTFKTNTPSITPSPSRTPTRTPSFSQTPTPTRSPMGSATSSPTPAGTASFTSSHTPTRSPSPTHTPTHTRSSTGTFTETRTSSPTQGTSPSFTPTFTRTVTATLTRTPSQTPTRTGTNTVVPSPSYTATPSRTASQTVTVSLTSSLTRTGTQTRTLSFTLTQTPLPGSPTFTDTPLPTGTATPTSTISGTLTATGTLSSTRTLTSTLSLTATRTITATHTPTQTPSATRTATPSSTETSTRTASPTVSLSTTITPVYTPTASPTVSETFTPAIGSPTSTSTQTLTVTSSRTATATQSLTSTLTSTLTRTRTSTPGATSTSSRTVSPTLTRTPSSTPTSTISLSSPTHTRTFTPTATPSLTPTLTLTATRTSTATATPSRTPTFSSTPTPSATPSRSVSPSQTVSGTAYATTTPVVLPVAVATAIYEAFESGTPPLMLSAGDGAGSTISAPAQTAAQAQQGSQSMHVLVSTSGGTLGAGATSASTAAAGSPLVFDATGALAMQFYVLTDQDIQFFPILAEANSGASDPANEAFIGSVVKLAASASWQLVVIPIQNNPAFEHGLNPQCAPNCASTGNNSLDLDKISQYGLQFMPLPQTSGANVYVDALSFLKPAGPVPTATWTPDASGAPIEKILPDSNPNPSALTVKLKRPVEQLSCKVYSEAMAAMIQEVQGPFGAGWARLALPASFLNSLPNGTYHYVITADSNGEKSRVNGLGTFVVIK